MQKKSFKVAPLGALAVMALGLHLAACTPETPQPPQNNAKPAALISEISDGTTGLLQQQPAFIALNDQAAVLYQTRDERIAFKLGDTTLLLDDATPIHGGNRPKLYQHDQNIYATWWSPKNNKSIYMASSKDGGRTFSPAVMVNSAQAAPLPPYSLLTGTEGRLSMVYMDERAQGFQVYTNHSTDKGLSWNTKDQRLDTPAEANTASTAMFPLSLQTDQAWVVVWNDTTESMGRKLHRTLASRSSDQGQTWSPPSVLSVEQGFISELTSASQGNNLFIVMEVENKGLRALVSNDHGEQWTPLPDLAGSMGKTNSGIQAVVQDGYAHVVWNEESSTSKARIMRARADVQTAVWLGDAERLDVKPFENTLSTLPTITAAPQGRVLAAWVDYRDIRPNIYLSASIDSGSTWHTPQALNAPGVSFSSLPELKPWLNDFAISFQTFNHDGDQASGKMVIKALSLDNKGRINLPTFPALADEAKRKKLLTQRAEAFWKHRVAGEMEQTHEFFDYAFKKANPMSVFLPTQGMLTYHSATVESVKITGNEAEVTTKLHYEVKPIAYAGKSVTMPAQEADVVNTWVWMGDTWYFVNKPFNAEPLLRY